MVGTNLTFDKPAEDEAVLLFSHADWREPLEFLHHGSTKWASLLSLALKAGPEGGEATLFPGDLKISSWG